MTETYQIRQESFKWIDKKTLDTFLGFFFLHVHVIVCLLTLPNNKILTLIKLKAFADHKFNVAYVMTSFFCRAANNVEKEENPGYQHFLLFPQCFQKLSVSRSLKVGIVW